MIISFTELRKQYRLNLVSDAHDVASERTPSIRKLNPQASPGCLYATQLRCLHRLAISLEP